MAGARLTGRATDRTARAAKLALAALLPLLASCQREPEAPLQIPRHDRVVVLVLENRGADDIFGNPDAPYLNQLAAEGAKFTASFGVARPSLPNYFALFAGSIEGVKDNSCAHNFVGRPNLGRQLIDGGFSFAGYSEGLPAVGSTACVAGTAPHTYQRKHNAWVYYDNVPPVSNQPFSAFPTDFTLLPTVSFVVPDQCNDMHDIPPCSSADGDRWVREHLDAYAQWAKKNNSLLIVTFDEDDFTETNHIPTIFFGANVKPGHVEPSSTDHYRVLATLQAIYGLERLGEAANRRPIESIWIPFHTPPPQPK